MNISSIKDCYGCGLCVISCPVKIIEVSHNSEGFYEPKIISADKCTDCSLCTSICSYLKEDIALKNPKIKSYAAWSKDEQVRRKCSSGGVGFELGRTLITKGYKVCGVRYNSDINRAEHYIATTIEDLIPSIGSKYIQSYTIDGLKAIDRQQKYLVTGTPCQIDSFRRYIQRFKKEDHFVLMDFFCHGVPSVFLWNKYIQEVEKVTGRINYVSWRNKATGWHDSYVMSIDGDAVCGEVDRQREDDLLLRKKNSFYNSRLSQGDAFYRLFLSDTCLGRACYEKCKFKHTHSAADIRIGDLWGFRYRKNEKGVNGVLTLTDKGESLLHSITSLHVETCHLEVVSEGQMKNNPKMPCVRMNVIDMLRDDSTKLKDILLLIVPHLRKQKIKTLLRSPLRVLKNRLVKYFNL